MSPYRRNVLVGITVLLALGILGWMMIQFGGTLATPFGARTINIQARSVRGDGLVDGSPVLYRGVQVGQIRSVTRSSDNLEVIIDARVELTPPPLPANLRGSIVTQSALGGGSALHLELTGPQPEGQLREGAMIPAEYVGLEFLPREFSELATELRETVKQFRESEVINHLDAEVQNFGKAVESIRTLVDDEKVRDDLKASIANIRTTTEKADRIAARLETLSDEASETMASARGAIGRTESEILSLARQFGDRLSQLARLVDQFQSISAKIDEGQGTAGQFINDPKLYEAMVDTARQMNATVSDLRRLVQQWEQEGVSLKLK